MQNVTLLAPVNLAFVEAAGSYDPWDDNNLLRYILNQEVSIGNLTGEEAIYDTLYNKTEGKPYPVKIKPDNDVYVIDDSATIVEEDIYANHQKSYIQAIDKLLPVKETMCDVFLNSEEERMSIVRQLFRLLFPENEEDSLAKKKKKKTKRRNQKNFPHRVSTFFVA